MVYLARMHYFGDGIERDADLACALYEHAIRINETAFRDPNSRAKFRRILSVNPCQMTQGAASAEIRALVDGCFWPGMTHAQFATSAGLVTIDRSGVTVQTEEREQQSRLIGVSGCTTLFVTPFAHQEVNDSSSTKAKNLFYVFGYEGAYEGSNIVRTLHWYLFELVNNELQLRTNQSVDRLQDVRSPAVTQHPELLSNVNLRAGNNTVEWSLSAWHLKGSVPFSPSVERPSHHF